MRSTKTIFLVDMDAFFASVHQAENPKLQGQPVIVSGDREKRTGIVLAKSYECLDIAPIRTAMPLAEALTLLPEAVVVRPDHKLYQRYSVQVRKVLSSFSPLMEPFSIDEAFLDMTGTRRLFGEPIQAAQLIQQEVEKETGLNCSVGIGENRFLAKMASGFRKPQGISTLWLHEVKEKLFPLPIQKMFGVGEKTAQKLRSLSIATIGDLAHADEKLLVDVLGTLGHQLHERALGHGMDDVVPGRYEKNKSIGKSKTFDHDLYSVTDLWVELRCLVDEAARRMRKENYRCRRISISLKDSSFQVKNHSLTFKEPILLTREIRKWAFQLLRELYDPGTKIRLVGVSLELLESGDHQISLFSKEGEEELEHCLDDLQNRFGPGMIQWGHPGDEL